MGNFKSGNYMSENLCKNCASTHVYPYADLMPKIFGNRNYRVLLCRDCGVGTTVPQPTVSIDHYVDSNRLEIISDVMRTSIRSDLLRIKKEYQRIFGRAHRSLLDVGCGNGLFLQIAKELGFGTHGIEPSTAMCNRVKEKGVTVTQCGIADYENYHQYDLVVLSSVIEHLPNPRGELQFLADKIGPNTVLCFQQAVFDGLIPKLLRAMWYGWSPQEHYWHFSSASFEKFIEQHQLRVVNKSRANLYYQFVPMRSIRHWKSFLFSNLQKMLSLLAALLRLGDSVTFYVVRDFVAGSPDVK